MKKDNYIKTEDLFRILGVRQNSSIDDITKAYHDKLKRLSSADYADEPEYAARKKAELSNAYSLLTGRTALPLRPERHVREQDRSSTYGEEKRQPGRTVKSLKKEKDDVNAGKRNLTSSGDNTRTNRNTSAFGSARRSTSTTGASGRNTSTSPPSGPTTSRPIPLGRSKPMTNPAAPSTAGHTNSKQEQQPAMATLIVALCIIISIFGVFISDLSFDSDDGYSEDITYEDNEITRYVYIDIGDDEPLQMNEREYNVMNRLVNEPYSIFGFKDYLDDPAGGEAKDFNDKITDVDEEKIYEYVDSISCSLEIYDRETAVDAMVEQRGYYEDSKPSEIALLYAKLLKAPGPEDLSGKISVFTGEPISDFPSYYEYIKDVVEQEAFEVLN